MTDLTHPEISNGQWILFFHSHELRESPAQTRPRIIKIHIYFPEFWKMFCWASNLRIFIALSCMLKKHTTFSLATDNIRNDWLNRQTNVIISTVMRTGVALVSFWRNNEVDAAVPLWTTWNTESLFLSKPLSERRSPTAVLFVQKRPVLTEPHTERCKGVVWNSSVKEGTWQLVLKCCIYVKKKKDWRLLVFFKYKTLLNTTYN